MIAIAPLAVLHAMHAPRRGPFGTDPSYYMQAAQHVARGEGLLTSVSQYFEGINPLPQPFDDYPLWPLTLGAFGSVIGVVVAANVLPQVFFIVDLLLLYLLANRLAGSEGILRLAGEDVDVGHLVALVMGLNFIFFTATADPYTEGLAFALAIGSFLLLDRRPAWSGLLAGLSVLTRYQMALVPVATVLVIMTQCGAAVLRGDRRRGRRRHTELARLAAYASVAAAVVLSWVVYLRIVNVQHAAIGRWQEWVAQPTLPGRVMHVVRGLGVAANPFDGLSLFHSFGPVVIVVAIAIFWLRGERDAALWSIALAGIGSMIALANFESVRPPIWVFGSRHSLAFVFLLVPALVVTLTKPPPVVRIVSLALAAASIGYGGWQILNLPTPAGHGLTGADHAMMQWLDTHAPHATLLTTRAQELSVYGDERFHWTHCVVDPAKTRLMLDRLPIDYVIVDDAQKSCAFVRGLTDVLATEAIFSDDLRRVYLFRVMRKMTRTGAPSSVHTATGL